MIENFKIHYFRNLDNIELDDLKRINILVGQNNTGKTSVLEAVQMLKSSNVFDNLLRISRQRVSPRYSRLRTMSMYESIMYTFNRNQKTNKNIEICAKMMDKSTIDVQIYGEESTRFSIVDQDYEKENDEFLGSIEETKVFEGDYIYNANGEFLKKPFSIDDYSSVFGRSLQEQEEDTVEIRYISPVDYYIPALSLKNLSEAIKAGDKHNLIKLLQEFDKDINGVEIIVEGGRPAQYISHYNNEMIPLEIFGDGLKKILNMASMVVNSRNGILLIDEIETAIHKDALTTTIKWLVDACKEFNVQILLTTHSLEAIDAILEGVKENLDDVACYRLELYNKEICVNRWSGKKLYKTRKNQGLDVR